MKIYNISDTKRLFNILSTCDGTVEIKNTEGTFIKLETAEEKGRLNLLAQIYASGKIDVLELRLHDPRDQKRLYYYTMLEAA